MNQDPRPEPIEPERIYPRDVPPGPGPMRPGGPQFPPGGFRVTVDPAALFAEMHKRERFIQALRVPARLTIVLIALNAIAYALVAWRFGPETGGVAAALFAGGDSSELIAAGAKYNPFLARGEYWRLFACTFLHGGIFHIVMNMMALWNLGRVVENLYGRAAFLVIYLGAGLAGSLASWQWPRDDFAPAIGASGAVFGLIGAGMVLGIRYRRALPATVGRRIFGSLAFWGGLSLVIGWLIPFIDNSAHLGGLAGGAALALLIPAEALDKRPFAQRLLRIWIPSAVLTLACVASLGMAVRNARYMDLETRVAELPLGFYANRGLGFSVKHPESWSPASEDRGWVVFQEGPRQAMRVHSSFVPTDGGGNALMNVDAAVEQIMSELRRTQGVTDLLEQERADHPIPGAEAIRVYLSFRVEGQPYGLLIYVVKKKTRLYSVEFPITPGHRYPLALADRVFTTFKVLD